MYCFYTGVAMACFPLLCVGYDTEVICVYDTEVICVYDTEAVLLYFFQYDIVLWYVTYTLIVTSYYAYV